MERGEVEELVSQRRFRGGARCAAAIAFLTIALAPAAHAVPVVSIQGATGIPGGTVTAVLNLAGDDTASAVSAEVTINFASPPLFAGTAGCLIAERLSDSHQATTETPSAGAMAVAITPLDEPSPLENGALANCEFIIGPGVPAGTAMLTLTSLVLRDAEGEMLPAETMNGDIVIQPNDPTPTPTATVTSTATRTHTPRSTPTETPTVTPTGTFFFVSDKFGGCNVVGPTASSAWPLLGLLAAFWLRRRSD